MSKIGNCEDLVFLEVEDWIGTIYLNRPEKRNALTYEMWVELIRLVEECTNDHRVKVIVFRSTNQGAFSAGADIREFKTLRSTPEQAAKYNQLPMTLEEKISNSPKPSIAMIQGYCVGGGCEIAVACDFRFTDETGKFGITPAKLGHVYNTPGTKNLVDLVGPSNAKDILFTGRIMDAKEAYHMGLVNRVVEADLLEKETYSYAKMIAENAQFSVRGSKFIINEVLKGATQDEDNEKVVQLIHDSFQTADYQEGIQAFIEKRKPKFGKPLKK